MKLITLDEVPFPKLVDCFNLAFSDYFVKFQVDETYLRTRWHGANMHYGLSAGVMDGEKLVGFIVIGIGEWHGKKASYNGGTGVIPSHRGNGYTSKMYEFLFPKFKTLGIKCHTLEVIQENVKAIHLYEKVGLKIERGLNCYSGEIQLGEAKNKKVVVKEVNNLDWKLIQSFLDYKPSWDNSTIAIFRNRSNYRYFGVFEKERLVGYVVVKKNDGAIMQFGIKKEMRRKGIGSTLFYFLKKHFPKIKINNIDDREHHVISFVEHIGLQPVINQYEMVSYL